MKIALATHVLRGYPIRSGGIPTTEARRALFTWARKRGFDGIEVGDWWFDFYQASLAEAEELAREIASHGLELAGFNCLRKSVTHPAVAAQNRRDLRRAVEVAAVLKPKVVSISLSVGPDTAGIPADRDRGADFSPGSSAEATDAEFDDAARFLAELAETAGRAGVGVALELHHCSLADTSRSLLRLLDAAGHPNLSANPDLGNLLWAYAEPREPWYAAVERLAGRVSFWHVKNLQRVHVPEVNRAYFVHASLEAGDIDYRWALARFARAGFDSYLSIEGAGPGDLLAFAARGKAYLDDLIETLESGDGLGVQ
ncbi:MAG TPA: sugar phosphate isomerase/epimerase [Chloroflexota bacterium]|nr:sugar phosphate isomerase/epimerase [Chloroflexota bacterium]